MNLGAGARLGPYEVIAPLGAGGMGEVWKARDTRLGREVAIKVLSPKFAADPDGLLRFEQEAHAVAAVNHPNILALYDVGSHEEAPFVVTELLQGETLKDRLASGPLSPRTAVEIGVQIAHGLAAAHAKGVVHRDLKPSNVFVTSDGVVKILDFGLAKLMRPETAASPEGTTMDQGPRTESGAVLGTMGYISPEQLRGEDADARTDIFGFGCVLYEMLAGRSPFLRATGAETVTAIMSEDPPPLSGTGRAIAPALEDIVRRCLEKHSADRFSSAHDLALALRALSGALEAPVAAKPVPARRLRARKLWAAAAAGVALLAAAASLVLLRPSKRSSLTPRFDPMSVAVAPFENRTGDASLAGAGLEIADALTSDFLKTGELKVAAASAHSDQQGRSESRQEAGSGGDGLLRLAEEARSALVVAGAYDLRGDQLEVQARLVDPRKGKIIYSAAPVRCPRADPLPALEPFRQKMTGAAVWRLDRELSIPFGACQPPRYDALVEFRQSMLNYFQDQAFARAHFERAVALDPEFHTARIFLMDAFFEMGQFENYAKERAVVEADLNRMTPAERFLLRYFTCQADGRWLDALNALRELARMSDSPEYFGNDTAQCELALNRPRAAIQALLGLPADFDFMEHTAKFTVSDQLADAYHMAGDYEAQLKVARESQQRFPNQLLFYAQEVGALAALGRLEEIDKVIEACQSVPATKVFPAERVMLHASAELGAHGHREASLRLANQAVAWYVAHPEAASCEPCKASALRQAERWAEAKAIADARLVEKPDDLGRLGLVGVLAARLGDSAQARKIEEQLTDLKRPYQRGGIALWRARIAVQLREKDRAVSLLREAFAQGLAFNVLLHTNLDLQGLQGYPPFEELMKPKG
jgi:TolB-like protein